ncbi:MAG: hypothetical protein KBS95_01025 [Alistipes sp.]|nr:hypothetical protein [Candidatus Alistipes equi]
MPIFIDVNKGYGGPVSMGAKPIIELVTKPNGQRTYYVAESEENLIEINSFVP